MPIHFKTAGEKIIVFGQTFPHKEDIKGLGGRFNGVEKNWHLPNTPANLLGIRVLCEVNGGGELAASPSSPIAALTISIQTGSDLESNSDSANELLPPWDTEHLPPAKSRPTEAPTVDTSGLTVSQLMLQVNQVVTKGFPAPVWIVGEIQNFTMRSNTYHFNLADAKEGAADVATVAVKATAWPSALKYMNDRHGADKLKELFADGIKVRCLCRVTLYKDRGQISLSLEDVDPAFTKGELALARERLIKELRAKGLDRKNKELTLSAFPLRIGLISAEGSRAESDFLHQLESGGYPGTILYISAKMQGDKVPVEVTNAINQLIKKEVDAIIITRGGGSAADLRWFDASEIAYAIAKSPVPIIAAIGHHDDICVAEEICYLRQKTPTAAAQFVLDWFLGTRDRITELADRIIDSVSRRLDWLNDNLQGLSIALVEQSNNGLNRSLNSLNSLSNDLNRNGESLMQRHREALFALDKILTAADPTPWLNNGWTQLNDNVNPVRKLKDVKIGSKITARLIDGLITMEVTSTTEKGAKSDGKKTK